MAGEHAHDVAADVHGTAAARLAAFDQRYTACRRTLVGVLATAGRPLTMAEVLAADPGMAQSSAYRNLADLEAAGVVRRVVTDDEFARYELAEDLTGHHHHHLICSSCGAVEDFTISGALERSLDRALAEAAAGAGFAAEDHRLDLVGTCSGCR